MRSIWMSLPDTAARRPETVELTWPGGSRDLKLDDDGRATFPAVTTDQITLRVGEAEPVTSLDFSSNAEPVPVGISELRVQRRAVRPGHAPQHAHQDPLRARTDVDGQRHPYRHVGDRQPG